MRVVVVGGTGNVGSRLVDRLSEHPGIGHVVAASRRQPKRLADGVEWRRVDLSEGGFGTVLREADAVVHLAWLFQPTRVTQVTWRANVEGSARLLEAAAEAGVGAIVYASSVGAYSPRRSSERVDESWPTHGVPTAAYSVEKAYVERLLDSFENSHPEVRVVRLRPVFTFRAESAVQQRRLFAGPLVPARLVGRGRIPVLPDPGGLTFQAIHTDDVVQAYLQALTQPVSGAFNLAAEPVLDVPAVGRLLGVPVRRVPAGLARAAVRGAWAAHLVPASPGLFDLLAQAPILSAARARSELGWQPEHDAVAAVRALLEGFVTGRGAPTPPLGPDTGGPFRIREFTTGIGRRS